jgi:membrane protein involved in colicin uptake
MINGLQGMLVSAGVAALVAFGAGWKFGGDSQAVKCQKDIAHVRKVAEDLINVKLQEIMTLQAEKAQAQAEVAKVNDTTRKQFEELQTLLAADQFKREEAAIKVERAANQAARDARDAATRAQAAREAIQNVADKCAAAGVPDDVLSMLNSILAPTP